MKWGVIMRTVRDLSGVFAATDMLMGHKPIFEKPDVKKEDNNFQNILDDAIAKLKARTE